MTYLGRAILFGFLAWLIPLVVAIGIFPLRQAGSPLFETLMPIVLALCGVFFAGRYFRRLQGGYRREGFLLGILWFVMCVGLDLPMFLAGPMKMPIPDYMADIGLTYLIYPIITTGFGSLVERTARK